ncbi:hypothetical protein IHQ71_21445 [Rhizobium sp. TH2]|uniref:hypothetical protein n=1 Tax=Rhizobium sp. TH2 TaxID=2775403 RepID=UPI0021574D71|nr:hypothetical protein [Rhizobium sp. TH2]UVC07731.1 hypothetical protein IHQ71_21445 [Rhizobium sp. TH2]
MQIELMGFVTVVVGAAIFLLPISVAFILLVVCTVFGAASAISLPVLGGASILVPNLFLVFFVLRCLVAHGPGPAIEAIHVHRVGFLLLVITVFGLWTAFTYPYLFQGDAETMIVQRTAGARNVITLAPLRFSSNNITQSVYALGSLLCFIFTFAHFLRTNDQGLFVKAMLVVGGINLAFALADIVTHFTGTNYLLGFVRTANYALLTGAEKGGLKRISGTFPEASAFADYTVAIFAVTATLWLARIRSRMTGIVAGLSLVFLVLSTSATALVCLAIIVPVILLQSFAASAVAPGRGRPAALVAIAAGLPFLVVVVMVIFPDIAAAVYDFVDEIVLSKGDSQSGRERSAWNSVAYQTYIDTSWLGAGLGSARASSYILVLLSNIGLPGLVLFCAFVVALLARTTGARHDQSDSIVSAAKNGIFALLVTAVISGTGYDLGLVFYLLAGFIASQNIPTMRTTAGPYAAFGGTPDEFGAEALRQ